jgi:hypothetical protein
MDGFPIRCRTKMGTSRGSKYCSLVLSYYMPNDAISIHTASTIRSNRNDISVAMSSRWTVDYRTGVFEFRDISIVANPTDEEAIF